MSNLIDLPQRIFVTGAGGWIGRRFIELAATDGNWGNASLDGWNPEIHALLHRNVDDPRLFDRIQNGRIKIHAGDIRSPSDCDAFFASAKDAAVIHAAGIIHPERTRQFHEINTVGTENILESALKFSARRVVALGSNSPFGFNPFPGHTFDEQSPYHPYQGYGKSKKLAEDVTFRYIGKGLECCILRPPWFYGPGQPPRQTLFFSLIRNGKMPMVGSGHNQRSMVYTDNLAQAIALAASHQNAAGKSFWISDRRSYSMNEIIQTIREILHDDFGLDVRPGSRKLPGFTSDVAGIIDTLIQSSGFYHQKIHVLSEMSRNISCSTDLAIRELGYNPIWQLRDGMRQSIQWCLSEGHTI